MHGLGRMLVLILVVHVVAPVVVVPNDANPIWMRFTLMFRLKPDLYFEKSLQHAIQQALQQGKPRSHAVASSRNVSSQELSQLNFCESLHCDMRHALRQGKPRSQDGALAHHARFPLVALDLRHDGINR